MGTSSNSQLVSLLPNSYGTAGLSIISGSKKVVARPFRSTSFAPSSNAMAWIAAAVDEYLKMVEIIVTVSGGRAYAHASSAGYTTAGSNTTDTLTDSIVNDAFNSRTTEYAISNYSSIGFGVADAQFSIQLLMDESQSTSSNEMSLNTSVLPSITSPHAPTSDSTTIQAPSGVQVDFGSFVQLRDISVLDEHDGVNDLMVKAAYGIISYGLSTIQNSVVPMFSKPFKFRGSASAINAILKDVFYIPPRDFVGSDEIFVIVKDSKMEVAVNVSVSIVKPLPKIALVVEKHVVQGVEGGSVSLSDAVFAISTPGLDGADIVVQLALSVPETAVLSFDAPANLSSSIIIISQESMLLTIEGIASSLNIALGYCKISLVGVQSNGIISMNATMTSASIGLKESSSCMIIFRPKNSYPILNLRSSPIEGIEKYKKYELEVLIHDPDASDSYCPSGTSSFYVTVSVNVSELLIRFSQPFMTGVHVIENSSSTLDFLCTADRCNGNPVLLSFTTSSSSWLETFLITVAVSDQGSCGSIGDKALVVQDVILAPMIPCDLLPSISFQSDELTCYEDTACSLGPLSMEESCRGIFPLTISVFVSNGHLVPTDNASLSSFATDVDIMVRRENSSYLIITSMTTNSIRNYLSALSYIPDTPLSTAENNHGYQQDKLVLRVNNTVATDVLILPIRIMSLGVTCKLNVPDALIIHNRNKQNLQEVYLVTSAYRRQISLEIQSKYGGSLELSLQNSLKSGILYVDSNSVASSILLLTGTVREVQRALELLDYRPPTEMDCSFNGGTIDILIFTLKSIATNRISKFQTSATTVSLDVRCSVDFSDVMLVLGTTASSALKPILGDVLALGRVANITLTSSSRDRKDVGQSITLAARCSSGVLASLSSKAVPDALQRSYVLEVGGATVSSPERVRVWTEVPWRIEQQLVELYSNASGRNPSALTLFISWSYVSQYSSDSIYIPVTLVPDLEAASLAIESALNQARIFGKVVVKVGKEVGLADTTGISNVYLGSFIISFLTATGDLPLITVNTTESNIHARVSEVITYNS